MNPAPIDDDSDDVHGRLFSNLDPNMDPKKLKRIISNRVSAQKSRMKKVQYVTQMESKAKALVAEIAVLHPQVSMYREQQQVLQMEHDSLNQQLCSRAVTKLLKHAEIEEHKAEVNRLRQLHLTLQQQKMQEQMMVPGEALQELTVSQSKAEKAAEMNDEMWMLNPNGQIKHKTNSNLDGIEQILNFNINPPSCVK